MWLLVFEPQRREGRKAFFESERTIRKNIHCLCLKDLNRLILYSEFRCKPFIKPLQVKSEFGIQASALYKILTD